MNDLQNLTDYFNRIKPIVGETLRNKRVAFFNPTFSCLVADALARCGVTHQWYYLDQPVVPQDAIFMTYDHVPPEPSAAKHLIHAIQQHNNLEQDWHLNVSVTTFLSSMVQELRTNKIDLIVGGGNLGECRLINWVARQANIPAVIFLVFDGLPVNSLVYISHPDLPDNLLAITACLPESKVLSQILLPNRLRWLEVVDLALNFSKALLLRGTPYQRADLEELFFIEQRHVVLRGRFEWPWWVHYLNPATQENYLRKIFSQHFFIPPPPIDLLRQERVMVIGCGTDSLLIGELVNYFRNLLFVDYKAFSIFNPVRQLVGTSWVSDEPKPFVLQKFLAARLDPTGTWDTTQNDLATTMSNGFYSLNAVELCLKSKIPGAVQKFEALLDWFQPTLVIVSMGRARDDNFVACEILRRRGIKHLIPTAFAGATHFETIVVDSQNTPCYECLQGRLRVDVGQGVELSHEISDMLYANPDDPVQPATIVETWPDMHMTLRLALELALPQAARAKWFADCLHTGRTCFVGGNQSVLADTKNGGYTFGVAYPGQVVLYGISDFVGLDTTFTCQVCGQTHQIKYQLKEGE